jgi:GDP/UDP-N,N'-diacetylbacillosamine 2-epimerase (hydrolysing)
MESTLRAIQSHPKLKLQIIATGMHLDPAHGEPLSSFYKDVEPTVTIPWPRSNSTYSTAAATGEAINGLAQAYREIKADIVMVVGDRVEAFAAASAAYISQLPVAHIHGGDRALGQIDDSLRHAITKLSHIHFPATVQSARRIARMGEDGFRIHRVGSPAVGDIMEEAWDWPESRDAPPKRRYALLVLHPTTADDASQRKLARKLVKLTVDIGFNHTFAIYPNNDPGSRGIIRAWDALESMRYSDLSFYRDLPRSIYLGLLKHAAVLVGNSSSGIIEAASFGTPVINIGDRQKGRERNKNVIDVPADPAAIRRALKGVWNNGRPIRFPRKNIYGSGRTSDKIARILATIPLDDRLRRKLIAY